MDGKVLTPLNSTLGIVMGSILSSVMSYPFYLIYCSFLLTSSQKQWGLYIFFISFVHCNTLCGKMHSFFTHNLRIKCMVFNTSVWQKKFPVHLTKEVLSVLIGIARKKRRFSMITTSKLAKLAGVSQSTISRCLNDHPSISFETKERVQKLALKYGYVEHKTGKKPSSPESNR